jgi:hypothetical protein
MNYNTIQPPKPKKKTNPSNQTNPNTKKRMTNHSKKSPNANNVNNLVNKSTKRMNRKQILVEDIDQVPDDECADDFFCFGKGYTNKQFRQL